MAALNKHWKLPKYIAIVLDDDIINYVKFRGCGSAQMYGELLERLVQDINEHIRIRLTQLPKKAVKKDYPHIYWVALPQHQNLDNETRSKFNNTLESILKLYPSMRLAKIKDNWQTRDPDLVFNEKLTATGVMMYWRAIDASLKFNIQKRERLFTGNYFQEPPKKRVLQSYCDAENISTDTRRFIPKPSFRPDWNPRKKQFNNHKFM